MEKTRIFNPKPLVAPGRYGAGYDRILKKTNEIIHKNTITNDN